MSSSTEVVINLTGQLTLSLTLGSGELSRKLGIPANGEPLVLTNRMAINLLSDNKSVFGWEDLFLVSSIMTRAEVACTDAHRQSDETGDPLYTYLTVEVHHNR